MGWALSNFCEALAIYLGIQIDLNLGDNVQKEDNTNKTKPFTITINKKKKSLALLRANTDTLISILDFYN